MKELKLGAPTYQRYPNTSVGLPYFAPAMNQATEPQVELWQSSEELLRAQFL